MMPDPWTVFGGFHDNGTLACAGSDWYVEMHEFKPEGVVLHEDPDGEYRGWIVPDSDGTPVMVQHAKIYPIQFAYGPEAEEKKGRGRTVRLRIERIDGAHA